MSYKTVEVELEHGRVRPRNAEALPERAEALLTILPPRPAPATAAQKSNAGLGRLLGRPDFKLTANQFKESMETDFWEQ